MKMLLTIAAITAALAAPAVAQTGNIAGNEAGGAEHGSVRATAVDKNDPDYTRQRYVTPYNAKKAKKAQARKLKQRSTTGAR